MNLIESKDMPKEWRPVWRFALLVGFVAVAAVYFLDWDTKRAAAAAATVVGPVDRKLDEHLTEVREARKRMEDWAQRNDSRGDRIERKLNALCQANPRAACFE